jgi:DDE_Tnp_1-associated
LCPKGRREASPLGYRSAYAVAYRFAYGADNWVAMEQYGNSKQEWLKQFLELPNGIPSHDTLARVFARIDPLEFEQCFHNWVTEIAQLMPGEIISIDGKTLKHSQGYFILDDKVVMVI